MSTNELDLVSEFRIIIDDIEERVILKNNSKIRLD